MHILLSLHSGAANDQRFTDHELRQFSGKLCIWDLQIGRIMEYSLPTAERRARWEHDFNAKGHIRQGRTAEGQLFLKTDDQARLCYAVVGSTIKLHGGDYAAVTSKSNKVGSTKDRTIYANTRVGKQVTGNRQPGSEQLSKWKANFVDLESVSVEEMESGEVGVDTTMKVAGMLKMSGLTTTTTTSISKRRKAPKWSSESKASAEEEEVRESAVTIEHST